MSTTLPTAERMFRQRWTDFWFAAGDPTTLGFIRIVTGLLVLYIHLSYSLDLQAFFGKYGWYGSAYIERERHEFPWMVQPFNDWDAANTPPRVPEFPHRRKAVIDFVRGLPEAKADQTAALRFLNRVTLEDSQATLMELNLLQSIRDIGGDKGMRPEDRAQHEREQQRVLRALAAGTQLYRAAERVYLADQKNPSSPPLFAEVLLRMSEKEREALANDMGATLRVMPEDLQASRYVVMHLMEQDAASRRALVEFLNDLPEDKVERERLTDYLEYWSNDPRKLHRIGHGITSVWFHVTNPGQMAAIHGAVLVVMALFTIGFCTRVTSVLTWLAALSYVQRTNQILFGMDTMMNILLVYLMIGNSGAALSVDRLIARYRAARASLRRSGTIDEPTRAFLAQAPPSVGANFGVRMIQIHFCFIYLAAGLSKLKGPGWWTGNAFWDVMINPEFAMLRYAWFESLVRSLASIKPLYYAITTGGVWFTLFLEIGFPFLVWTSLRPLMLWLAVLLHAGIGILMGLNLFELLMMVMMLVYLPPGVIRDRLRGPKDLKKLGYRFNPGDPTQARAAALVVAADVDGQLAVEPRTTDRPALVEAGSPVTGLGATTGLLADLRLLRLVRFVAWIPGVSGVLTRVLFPGPRTPPGSGTPRPQAPATAS